MRLFGRSQEYGLLHLGLGSIAFLIMSGVIVACGQVGVDHLPVDGDRRIDPVTDSIIDAGTQTDTLFDSGTGRDTGSSSSMDAGVNTDTMWIDGGDGADAGTMTDTYVPDDTAQPSTTGRPTETVWSSDTEGSVDAGMPTDNPTPVDTAIPTDTATGTTPWQSECDVTYRNAYVCQDFEDVPGWETDVSEDAGVLEIVNNPVYDGNGAMASRVNDDRRYAIYTGVLSEIETEDVYFRSYFYLPSDALSGVVKIMGIKGWDPEDERDELNVDVNVLDDGTIRVHLHQEARGETDDHDTPSGMVPFDEWFCLRGHIHLDNDEGSVALSVNAGSIWEITDFDTRTDNYVSLVDIGIGWTESLETEPEIYADNLVVDGVEIPCD